MIITCPKCKTEFEIGDGVLARGTVRFKCAECSYVWSAGERAAEPGPHPGARSDMDKGKLMHGLGVSDGPGPRAPDASLKILTVRNAAYFMCGVAFVFLALMTFRMASDMARGSSGIAGMFSQKKGEKIDTSKLYLELAKPLTLVKEGANEYVIMSGFIYNPGQAEMPVPKLVIRLENKDGRLLQEQEREIEAKSLAPLAKADFRFKVYKFSDQIVRFVVDFEEEK